jgi:peptidyl-prolyl cis-trans isomerase C
MRRGFGVALAPLIVLSLGGCRFDQLTGGKAPTGQVVATVDGQEITQLELQSEMAGMNAPSDPKLRKAFERKSLETIIARKLFAKVAHDEGLDRSPAFAMQKQRLTDTLLAQALEQNLAGSVPAPDREAAVSYVSSHPDTFAARKIFSVNQLRIAQPLDPKVLEAIKPLNTLADIEALLKTDHIAYSKGSGQIDAAAAPPGLVEAIVKLPPGEVFLFPSGASILVNQVVDTKVAPLTGEPAITLAMSLLKRQRTEEVVNRALSGIIAKSTKDIKYSQAFQPTDKAPSASSSPSPSSSPSTPASATQPGA